MFEYQRRIGMRDVDAAGVLFFARYLSLVHEAYEEMFVAHGIDFKDQVEKHKIILPVIHVDANYRLPLSVGDRTIIRLNVTDLRRRTYTVGFQFFLGEKVAADGSIVHACVHCGTKHAVYLPDHLVRVLRECSLPSCSKFGPLCVTVRYKPWPDLPYRSSARSR